MSCVQCTQDNINPTDRLALRMLPKVVSTRLMKKLDDSAAIPVTDVSYKCLSRTASTSLCICVLVNALVQFFKNMASLVSMLLRLLYTKPKAHTSSFCHNTPWNLTSGLVSGPLLPLNDQSLASHENCQAPHLAKQRGRPKKRRYKSAAERAEKRSLTCSHCHQQGHNRRSCRGAAA